MQEKTWMKKLERKYARYAIPQLMKYIVLGMAFVYIFDLSLGASLRFSLANSLSFVRWRVLQGQIWRVITFVFLPPNSSPLFIFFSMYFYWMIGQSLEQYWGSFRFNLYYFCGVLGTIIAGFISGYATNTYLNLTLFLAFAVLNPDFEIRLFFVLPIKMMWLAMFSALGLLVSFFQTNWAGKVSLIAALLNFALFFGQDFIDLFKNYQRRQQWKRDTRQ